ncbi:MAG: hypothetical protein WCP20_11465 [Desulfuromonadales bacterium]
MSLNDISLTAGMRSNLLALQGTSVLLDRTQQRLSTGKKVNTALDNPTNFFSAQNNTQRAADLSTRKDGMSEAIQGVKAANEGITGITALIEAARGLTQSARSADRENRDSLAAQFNTMMTQITQMAGDSSYKGKNFLTGDSLQVLFNENGGSMLTIQGFSGTSTGLSIDKVTVGTVDKYATGISTTQSSGSVIAAISLHSGELVTGVASTAVATGYYFGNTGTQIATIVAGANTTMSFDISGNAKFNATGMTWSGGAGQLATGFQITAVYFNGNTGAGGQGVLWTGSGANAQIFISGADLATAVTGWNSGTAVTVTFDIIIQGHTAGTSTAAANNMNVFRIATGDLGSGLTVSTMSTGAAFTTTGMQSGSQIYVKTGTALYSVDSSQAWVSGNFIVFTGVAIPPNSGIIYNYNTGFSLTSGVNKTTVSNFTGITLATGQSITAVKVAGVDVTANVTISGNQITFATGSEPAHGAAITYNITTAGATGAWAADAGIDTSVAQLDSALGTLRTQSASLASNLSVVNIRQDFTTNLMNDLLKGADNLTLADMNEEGANMLMLQTRQQLGTTSLKMASDAAQGVLRLF